MSKKIFFLPSGSKDLPTSRMKVYNLAEDLKEVGVSTTVIDAQLPDRTKAGILSEIKPSDIIYVQKGLNHFNLQILTTLKYLKKTCTLVYCISDRITKEDVFLARRAKKVIVSSAALRKKMLKINKSVHLVFTPIDLDFYKPPIKKTRRDHVKIIWTEYYAPAYANDICALSHVLHKLHSRSNAEFIIQGWRERGWKNGGYDSAIEKVEASFKFAKYKYARPYGEFVKAGIPILQDSDIAIFPFNQEMNKGAHNARCAMACGVAVVASRNNTHPNIITDGVDGFLAQTSKEWMEKLELLIARPDVREKVAKMGLCTVRSKFSRRAYMERIRAVLEI